MRILLIEDDARLSRIVEQVLRQERFDVDTAFDGQTGRDLALTGGYDALIIDRMLPKLDGIAILRALRREGIATPALMLTARHDLPDRVEGLDAGADDYLGKPFAFEELLARLRALLRRTDRPLVPETIELDGVSINLSEHRVVRDGREIALSPREFALLEMLARHRGQILSRDVLLERVWGYDADPAGNAVDLHIHYLRRKLDPAENDREPLIRTVRGAGYTVR